MRLRQKGTSVSNHRRCSCAGKSRLGQTPAGISTRRCGPRAACRVIHPAESFSRTASCSCRPRSGAWAVRVVPLVSARPSRAVQDIGPSIRPTVGYLQRTDLPQDGPFLGLLAKAYLGGDCSEVPLNSESRHEDLGAWCCITNRERFHARATSLNSYAQLFIGCYV